MHGSIQSTVILSHSPSAIERIEHALKQNRWLLIEFIPAASPSSLATSESTPGRSHSQHITTSSPDAISSKDVFNALKQSVLLNFGDVGWGEVGSSLAGERFIPHFFRSFLFSLFYFFLFVDAETKSKVFLPNDEPLHCTCRARRRDKHDLGSARFAG